MHRSMVIQWLCMIAIMLLVQSRCFSQVLTFVPGDAYFRSELTEVQVNHIEAGNELLWSYRMPDWLEPDVPKLRTFAGVPTLKTLKLPKSMSASLVSLYRALRLAHFKQVEQVIHEGKLREEREINGFPIFVYSKSYDVQKFGLGLRYNEEWPKITDTARKRRQLTPQEFFQPICLNHELIIKEWRWAEKVGAFPCLPLPNEDWQETWEPNAAYKLPIVADGEDLQFIVCTSRDVEATINDKPYHPYHCVIEDHIITYETVSNADLGEIGYRKLRRIWRSEELNGDKQEKPKQETKSLPKE